MKRILTAAAILAASAGAASAVPITVNWDAFDNVARNEAEAISGRFVPVTLAAGDYEVSIIDGEYTAMSYFNRNTGCNAMGENCSRGWEASYDILDSAGNRLINFQPRFDDPTSSRMYATPEQALVAGQADGPTPFTLSEDGIIYVGAIDNRRSDNRGGMSLVISEVAAVPVPAAGALLLGAIGAGAAAGRRRRA